MNPATYPSTGRDWEARFFGDFPQPQRARPARGLPDQRRQLADQGRELQRRRRQHGDVHRAFPAPASVRLPGETLDGVADDWPIDYDTLEPFFDENDRMMGVSGLAGDPLCRRQPPMPPLPLGRSGAARQGDEPARLALVAVRHRPSRRSITRDGRAASISAIAPRPARKARNTTDITYWPEAIRPGVELRTRCRVREITTNEHGFAAGVVYYDADGEEQFQRAEVVVIACNGVGTPRILLNSVSGRFPNGLANSNGLVGKNLMFHPMRGLQLCQRAGRQQQSAADLHLEQGVLRDRPVARLRTRLQHPVRPRRGAVGRSGGQRAAARCRGARASRAPSAPTAITSAVGDLRGSAGGTQPRDARPGAEGQQRHPGAEDHYTISDNSRKMMEHGLAAPKRCWQQPARRDLRRQPDLLRRLAFARHRAHGQRPGAIRGQPWGRSHDVKNLFIVDGSLFVTCGGVNPTRTIQALALYVADKMKQRLANLFD